MKSELDRMGKGLERRDVLTADDITDSGREFLRRAVRVFAPRALQTLQVTNMYNPASPSHTPPCSIERMAALFAELPDDEIAAILNMRHRVFLLQPNLPMKGYLDGSESLSMLFPGLERPELDSEGILRKRWQQADRAEGRSRQNGITEWRGGFIEGEADLDQWQLKRNLSGMRDAMLDRARELGVELPTLPVYTLLQNQALMGTGHLLDDERMRYSILTNEIEPTDHEAVRVIQGHGTHDERVGFTTTYGTDSSAVGARARYMVMKQLPGVLD